MRPQLSFASLSAALLAAATAAHADWPMNQHDPQRTAASTGVARLARPTRAWSRYIGGTLPARQVAVVDLDGNGTTELVMSVTGRLVARRGDDTPIWEGPQWNLGNIVAVLDLNGDGELDIVAGGLNGFLGVFGARDGRLEWRNAPGSVGFLGAVRVGDFNGDGRPDLYAADVGCGLPGSLGDVAFAYTFGRGFGSGVADATTQLWQLERGRDYSCGEADVLADLTGDGRPDVVTFSSQQVWLYDGATGRKISSGNDAPDAYGAYALGFSIPYGVTATNVVDVDGDGRAEIIGYTNNAYDPSINSRVVYVLAYDPNRPQAQRLFVRWRHAVASLADDQHHFIDNSATDLDRDGRPEVVTTFVTPGAGPTTYIRRGTDGTVLLELPGVSIAGIYDVGADQPPALVVARGTDLVGYQLRTLPASTPPPAAFTLPGARVVESDLVGPDVDSTSHAQITLPDPDGVHRALVVRQGTALQLISVQGGATRAVGSYELGTENTTAIVPVRGLGAAGEGLLVGRSDGRAFALDARLTPLDFGDPERPLQGVRTGGYATGGCGALDTPVAARLDRARDTVFVRDSRGNLLRLDAGTASRVQPPALDWEWPGAAQPAALDVNGDGQRDLVAITDTRALGARRTLTARLGGGATTLWSREVPTRATEYFTSDVVPLPQAGGPGALAVLTQDTGDGRGRVYTLGLDGAQIAASDPIYVADSGFGHLAALDIDGDGQSDPLTMMIHFLQGFSARTGALLARGEGLFTTMPVVVRGSAGSVDVIGGGALGPVGGYTVPAPGAAPPATIDARWLLPSGPTMVGCFAATVQCPDGLRFASARRTSSHLVIADAATGAVRRELVLAGGRAFATDDEARAANVSAGILGNVSGVRAIDGTTAAFAVGSSDGNLYAIDACAASPGVLWALDFGVPVAQPIFADTDGDGDDEIVISAADGNLYGLDTTRFAEPRFVYDTDPEHGIPDTDVDEIRGLAVHALWAPVSGAIGYEWALFTAAGRAITHRPGAPDNAFIPAAAGDTRADVRDGLDYGVRYYFVVRAIGPDGASSEALSDGVRILPEEPGTDGGAPRDGGSSADGGRTPGYVLRGGGCTCATPGAPPRSTPAAPLLALAALALGRRALRRRR